MIMHEVKIGKQKTEHRLHRKHRKIYVTSAISDLNYWDLLVYGRQRREFYINGTLDFTTCDRIDSIPNQWKRLVKRKIHEADGVFILVSENTIRDEDTLWEIDIALPEGKNGINDNGDVSDMKSIEEKVTAFRKWLLSNKHREKTYNTMVAQIDKYWKKLFADPIPVVGPDGVVRNIQPQRANNILERFFRDVKRQNRKKQAWLR